MVRQQRIIEKGEISHRHRLDVAMGIVSATSQLLMPEISTAITIGTASEIPQATAPTTSRRRLTQDTASAATVNMADGKLHA